MRSKLQNSQCFSRLALEPNKSNGRPRGSAKLSGYRLPETILYRVLAFLREARFIREYTQPAEPRDGGDRRGRPRRMFAVADRAVAEEVERLARFYHWYLEGGDRG
jgi:hypothetical protein